MTFFIVKPINTINKNAAIQELALWRQCVEKFQKFWTPYLE